MVFSHNLESPMAAATPIPPRRNPAGVPYPITVTKQNGYTVYVKQDGYDYLDLFNRLLRDEVPKKTLLYDDAEHFVYLVRIDGRAFIYKRFGEFDGKLDSRAYRFFAGPFYSNLMKTTNDAAAAGCEVVPDMYLVAEKMAHRLSYDNYLLMEFVPGTGMDKMEDVTPYKEAIKQALLEIHEHGIALGNVKPDHFLINEEGRLRIIDLSGRGSLLIGRAKDAVKVKRAWGIELPPKTAFDWLARLSASAVLFIAFWRRKIKIFLGLRKKP